MWIRRGKILLALTLFISGARESLHLWRQTGDVVSLISVLGVLLVCCGLLLWSASRTLDPLKVPSKGWRVFWTVMSVFCVLSILGQFVEIVGPRKYRDVFQVNGLKIPVDDCMEGSVRMFTKREDRSAFCECLATKLASDSSVVRTYTYELEHGRLDGVIQKLTEAGTYDMSQFSVCMANMTSATWTEGMIDGARRTCLSGLRANGSDVEYDAEKYCDCLVGKLSQHPPAEVAAGQEDSTSVVFKIQEECAVMSRR